MRSSDHPAFRRRRLAVAFEAGDAPDRTMLPAESPMNPLHRLTRRAGLLGAVLLPLTAQAFEFKGLFGKKGSGHVVHDESNPGEFDGIQVSGDFTVDDVA